MCKIISIIITVTAINVSNGIVIFIFIIVINGKVNIFTCRDIMKRLATKPGFYI